MVDGIQICICEVVYHQLNIENNLPLINFINTGIATKYNNNEEHENNNNKHNEVIFK